MKRDGWRFKVFIALIVAAVGAVVMIEMLNVLFSLRKTSRWSLPIFMVSPFLTTYVALYVLALVFDKSLRGDFSRDGYHLANTLGLGVYVLMATLMLCAVFGKCFVK